MAGWIKLYRCLMEKPIWSCSTPEQKSILITILLLANHDQEEWNWNNKHFICQPGQFITSLPSLAEASGCSIQNVRTALKRFQTLEFLTDELTRTSTGKLTGTGRLITVVNWEKYQSKNDKPTGTLTGGLTGELTPNKNIRSKKKEIIYTPDQLEQIKEVVDYLNDATGKNFSYKSKATQGHIAGRFREGHDTEDFFYVIDRKTKQWKNDKKFSAFLRPSTLFSPTNFENYLNE